MADLTKTSFLGERLVLHEINVDGTTFHILQDRTSGRMLQLTLPTTTTVVPAADLNDILTAREEVAIDAAGLTLCGWVEHGLGGVQYFTLARDIEYAIRKDDTRWVLSKRGQPVPLQPQTLEELQRVTARITT